MTRKKKAVDYINELCSSELLEKRRLGKKLEKQYAKWTESLSLKDFSAFIETIKKNKAEIGVAQFFGKFRAYAFEEYVYRLLRAKVHVKKPLQLFWGEKCRVWGENGTYYSMEFDVSIGRKVNGSVEPVVVVDAKVELDAARLKTALASFAILKKWNSKAKCFLVYATREIDSLLLEIAKNWMDGTFQLDFKNDETKAFIRCIKKSLSFHHT